MEQGIQFINDYRIYQDEEFRYVFYEDIKTYMYIVSNYGRVINIVTGNELSYIDNNGYIDIGVQNNDNSRRTVQVHRLVATAFIPKTYEDLYLCRNYVNHKNLCRCDNRLCNLEWVNHEENMQHASYMYNVYYAGCEYGIEFQKFVSAWGRGDLTKGEKNGMARLTEEQVHLICQALEKDLPSKDCLAYAGLEDTENNRFIVLHIKIGKRWKHISQLYKMPKARKLIDWNKYIIPICELLQLGRTNQEIYHILNPEEPKELFFRVINRIRNRKAYINISENYTF